MLHGKVELLIESECHALSQGDLIRFPAGSSACVPQRLRGGRGGRDRSRDAAVVALPELDEVVTPALIVDRARLVTNIREMAARASSLGVALRPHAEDAQVAGDRRAAARSRRRRANGGDSHRGGRLCRGRHRRPPAHRAARRGLAARSPDRAGASPRIRVVVDGAEVLACARRGLPPRRPSRSATSGRSTAVWPLRHAPRRASAGDIAEAVDFAHPRLVRRAADLRRARLRRDEPGRIARAARDERNAIPALSGRSPTAASRRECAASAAPPRATR